MRLAGHCNIEGRGNPAFFFCDPLGPLLSEVLQLDLPISCGYLIKNWHLSQRLAGSFLSGHLCGPSVGVEHPVALLGCGCDDEICLITHEVLATLCRGQLLTNNAAYHNFD